MPANHDIPIRMRHTMLAMSGDMGAPNSTQIRHRARNLMDGDRRDLGASEVRVPVVFLAVDVCLVYLPLPATRENFRMWLTQAPRPGQEESHEVAWNYMLNYVHKRAELEHWSDWKGICFSECVFRLTSAAPLADLGHFI